MNIDPIITEVINARREIFATHGNDPDRLFADVMKRQFEGGRPLLSRNTVTGLLEEVPAQARHLETGATH